MGDGVFSCIVPCWPKAVESLLEAAFSVQNSATGVLCRLYERAFVEPIEVLLI